YPELEPAEVLKRTREARPPRVGWHARELPTVDEDAPLRRLIQPAQQLHQCRLARTVFSHDGHHGPRCESEGHVVEHQPVRARIGEGHVLEADTFSQLRGHREVGAVRLRGGVVLHPGGASRTLQPDAAQEPRPAPGSAAARSTPGRQVDVITVGSASAASRASAGWIDTSSATATASRRIQPQVVNSDMYMWSSTKTWLRSIARRSRYAGRSWCSIVATDACSHATCDSRAMVTWSRNRRWMRS